MQRTMGYKKICLLILVSFLALIARATDTDITKYGAVADSTTLNTNAIQQAIDDCHKTGGGRVYFPAGPFLSGTIVLKDNVTLYFKKDAVLLGSTNIEDYKNIDPFADGLDID